MRYIEVRTKGELVPHQEAIEGLFVECFNHKSIDDIWKWAYLDNPNGEPLVTLCYEEETLVGHYAIIPMPLANHSWKKNSYLSMTTMVATSYRKFGLFSELAHYTYKMAAERGVDFIIGFPNSNSIPGFKKRLNWNLPPTDFVASLDKNQLSDYRYRNKSDFADLFRLDLRDEVIRNWRLSRPGSTYHWSGGVAWKIHNGQIDLIWEDESSDLESLPENLPINLIVPWTSTYLLEYKSFQYQFGGFSINSDFKPSEIARQMAISDLF